MTWEDGSDKEMTAKKGHNFHRRWLKRSSDFFKKKGWRPSVAAPGDTNPSDDTALKAALHDPKGCHIGPTWQPIRWLQHHMDNLMAHQCHPLLTAVSDRRQVGPCSTGSGYWVGPTVPPVSQLQRQWRCQWWVTGVADGPTWWLQCYTGWRNGPSGRLV